MCLDCMEEEEYEVDFFDPLYEEEIDIDEFFDENGEVIDNDALEKALKARNGPIGVEEGNPGSHGWHDQFCRITHGSNTGRFSFYTGPKDGRPYYDERPDGSGRFDRLPNVPI